MRVEGGPACRCRAAWAGVGDPTTPRPHVVWCFSRLVRMARSRPPSSGSKSAGGPGVSGIGTERVVGKLPEPVCAASRPPSLVTGLSREERCARPWDAMQQFI